MFPELANVIDSYNKDISQKTILLSQVGNEASFVVHHFISYALKNQKNVCLVSFAQSLSHYTNVIKKIGLNLKSYEENGQFYFIDGLKATGQLISQDSGENLPGDQVDAKKAIQSLICEGSAEDFYHLIKSHTSPNGILIVDDLSLLLTLGVLPRKIYMLMHYLKQYMCSVGMGGCLLSVISSVEADDTDLLRNQLWHQSDLVIEARGLLSGYCKDVHGQLTFFKRNPNGSIKEIESSRTLQYKVLDKNISLFAAGLSSAVI